MSMKRKLGLIFLTLLFLVGFGAFLHASPSMMDIITGATPGTKWAKEKSAQLNGDYVFCIHTAAFEDPDDRESLKALIAGETPDITGLTDTPMTIYVAETDYALVRYVSDLCDAWEKDGLSIKYKTYNPVMLRSRAASQKYDLILASTQMLDPQSLQQTDDWILLHSAEMR